MTRPTSTTSHRRDDEPRPIPEVTPMLAHHDHSEDLAHRQGRFSDEDWMDAAACKGRTNLFFGIAGERPERRARREAQARKVCQGCPVLLQCRTLARTNRENGFWGGESEEERAAAGYPPRSISRRAVQEAAVRAS